MVLYPLIFWSVNKGVSIDEGYYLLGYLGGQDLGPGTTDFHRIVRTIFFFIPEDNVLMFRWVRVVLTILLLLLFHFTALRWLEGQYGRFINRGLYYGMSLLAGTLCFAYASPVIYYDNMQLMAYLLVFSLLFAGLNVQHGAVKFLSFAGAGFVMVFGLANYPPSGMLLIGLIFLLTGIYAYPAGRKMLLTWTALLGGLAAGAIIYSMVIHNLMEFFREALWAYANSAKAPKAKYDAGGQWLIIGKYFMGMLKVYLPLLGLGIVYFLLAYRKLVHRMLLNFLFGLILLVAAYRLSGWFSNILLLPALLLLANAGIQMVAGRERFRLSKNFIFALLLMALPLLAVAGSNQRLEMKMVYFMPFWALAYFILLAEFKKHFATERIPVWHTAFIIVFFVVFAAQGFLKHIHYNYSIKRSRYLVENAKRFTNIGVSEYQCDFYETGIRQLKKAGFKPGGEVLAFYETFMLVYMAGGYVPHRLTYSAEFFVNDRDNIPPEKAGYIIIDEYQVPMLTHFLAGSGWDFPISYNVVELGTDGHNLTKLGYNYLLFYSDR
ncbi:MAG: hypothetical protein RQ761_11865 [Bacteroidales bacterium]|nr:hypothetical protein [Bacteroidales bacterium]